MCTPWGHDNKLRNTGEVKVRSWVRGLGEEGLANMLSNFIVAKKVVCSC
jgi:hypothetical protein